jgi:hypothetical protein
VGESQEGAYIIGAEKMNEKPNLLFSTCYLLPRRSGVKRRKKHDLERCPCTMEKV